MYIKKNLILKENEFAGFELDTSAIELHSSDKKNIRLPYLGKLPDAVRANDGAYISANITMHLNINICMVIKLGNKERRYPVEATAKEIDDDKTAHPKHRFFIRWACLFTFQPSQKRDTTSCDRILCLV